MFSCVNAIFLTIRSAKLRIENGKLRVGAICCALLVATVAAVTVGVVWLSDSRQNAANQFRLRTELATQSHGHGVAVYRVLFIPPSSKDEPWSFPEEPQRWGVPRILLGWLGEDFFSKGIYAIAFNGTQPCNGGETIQEVLNRARPCMEGLSDVELIDLSDTDLTDEGLMQLVGMTNLRFVMAANTKVTKTGVDSLTAKLPHVRVFLDRRCF